MNTFKSKTTGRVHKFNKNKHNTKVYGNQSCHQELIHTAAKINSYGSTKIKITQRIWRSADEAGSETQKRLTQRNEADVKIFPQNVSKQTTKYPHKTLPLNTRPAGCAATKIWPCVNGRQRVLLSRRHNTRRADNMGTRKRKRRWW